MQKKIIQDNTIAAMTSWRREFHQCPEVGMEEKLTSKKIETILKSMPVDEVVTAIAGTGVVAVIKGKHPSKQGNNYRAIGLRADIDALPLQENGTPFYKSKHPGIMHACGHDGHMAMLLGATQELAHSRDFAGNVYAIFQPGEEGFFGAQKMIEEGLFDRFPMDAIFGMHGWPDLPLGEFGLAPGAIMANSDELYITITGKGGHGAQPHHSPDPIVALSELILSLQTIVSRRINPHTPAVISITEVHSGTTHNIIPATARLSGTARSLSSDVREFLKASIFQIAEGIAAIHNVKIDINYVYGYPVTINSERETTLCKEVISSIISHPQQLHYPVPASLGGEDFSYFAEKVPACYIHLGIGTPSPLHHPDFDFPDEALAIGAKYWITLARTLLA
ncbi:MAG: amidohydrolase [Oligoflexia bacterium]|nr:amidohydrolase [Oligoflexia bacterium]